MSATDLSLPEARRITLAAQGFAAPRPKGPVTARHVEAVIRRLGLLQLDFVNVVAPAHRHVVFSRLGPYDIGRLHDVVYRRRLFTERWAHEASIVPVEDWPLLRHRMDEHRLRPYGFEDLLAEEAAYAARVLELVRERGPIAAGELPAPESGARSIPGSWFRSVPRAVLEAYFGRGHLAIADRLPDFTRVYDLAERVVPAEHLTRRIDRSEAQRALLLKAAKAHGVATANDLADYYRMPVREAAPRLAELAEGGALRTVRVEGWREAAFLWPGSAVPPRIDAAALLSPFDPVVWFRRRTLRLFDFEYRFEIFVPDAQRRWGTYVFPFLLGDRLVARVDLKADRPARTLRVVGAHVEDGIPPGTDVIGPLASELGTLAGWLGLDRVAVRGRGGFARLLGGALKRDRA